MEIKIELDLPAIVANAVSAERVQPLVDKAVAEAIADAIRGATDYNSEFRKELKKQLAEVMPKGLAIDDVAKFQLMINRAATEAVHGENAKTIQVAMNKAIEHVTPDVPERIKLSELLKEARGGLNKDAHEDFYAHLEMSDYGGGWLSLDDDASCREKYRAHIRLGFNKEGEVFSLRLDGVDMTPKKMPDVVSRFSGILLSMYVGRTSLELDMDEDDVESAAQGEYTD